MDYDFDLSDEELTDHLREERGEPPIVRADLAPLASIDDLYGAEDAVVSWSGSTGGSITTGGTITATGQGSFAMGYATTGTITASHIAPIGTITAAGTSCTQWETSTGKLPPP